MRVTKAKKRLKVAVRADAGPAVGYGHVRRTLAVVSQLRNTVGVEVRYLMRRGSDPAVVESAGYDVVHLSSGHMRHLVASVEPSDGPLILDSYAISLGDLEHLRQLGYCTVVFDDGRRLDSYPAGAVVDYAPDAQELPYQGLETTRFCLGTDYFPLRPEFVSHRLHGEIRSEIGRIIVTFGGSDPSDQTARILELLNRIGSTWHVTAVLGPGYEGRLKTASPVRRVDLRRDVADMAPLLAGADLAISNGGGTSLELAYLGIPSLLLILSEDQRPIASALERAGAAVSLGWYAAVSDDEIEGKTLEVAGDGPRLNAMRAAGQDLVDGLGAERIARTVLDVWHGRNGVAQTQ